MNNPCNIKIIRWYVLDSPLNSIIAILIFAFINLQISTSCFAQNLVPNPGFESFTCCGCPTSFNSVSGPLGATSWVLPTQGTSDYFNACSTTPAASCSVPSVGIPINEFGTESAHGGTAYAGLITWDPSFPPPGYREYIQAQFTTALAATTYNVIFYVSDAESQAGCFPLGAQTNNLGAYISATAPTRTDGQPIAVTPQINSTAVITTTSGWVAVSGTFVAAGGEQYITIGNFFNDASTTVAGVVTDIAYYYIDDVCVATAASGACPIPALSPLTTTIASTNPLCNGQCTGIATTNPTGGTSPYTYSWNTLPLQTTQSISNLCAGTYSVTVTDATSTTTTATITITEPAALSATASSTATTCGNNNGAATGTSSGGTPGYSYSWNSSPAQSTSTATGLAAGNYTATVTDANGCTTTQTIAVASSNGPSATLSQINILCNGQCTGSSVVTATSGTAPYTYSWSNGQITANATSLCAAPYTVTVTDNNSCTTAEVVTITQPPPIPITASAIPATVTAGSSTQLTATGGGTYQWSPSAGLSCDTCASPIATPTATTTYSVTVTGTGGCTAIASIAITVELPCGEIFIPNAFSPNNDGTNELECVMGGAACFEKIHFAIYDRWGEKVFETTDPNDVCWDGFYKGKLMNTAVFVYYLRATLINGEELKKEGNISLIR